MANNAFLASLYGEVTTYDKLNGGWQVGTLYNGAAYRSLPVVGTQVIAISPAQVFTSPSGATITANSIIEIFPQGLAIPGFSRKFLCDATVATLNTART